MKKLKELWGEFKKFISRGGRIPAPLQSLKN